MASARALPWLMFGREVRPCTLALAVYTSYSAYAALLGVPGRRGSLLTEQWATVSGTIGLAAAAALFIAWWLRSETVLGVGLLAAAWYWLFLAVLVSLVQAPWAVSAVGAFCWGGLALGLWWRDHHARRPADAAR